MKTLVIIAHPNLEESKVNARWMKELKKEPGHFTVHNLYEVSKDGDFDVAKEQQLVESHDKLIFQFPIYWFNCPPLMKKWLDEVGLPGWAYGAVNKMRNRDVALLVTAGIKEIDYRAEGRYLHTMAEVLVPFETTLKFMEANYKGFYSFYGAEYEPTEDMIEQSTLEMIEFAKNI